MPTAERVLCISAQHFQAIGAFTGFRVADEAYREMLLNPLQYSFRPRAEVETDPNFLQLIPYVVLQCGSQIFQYRRGASGTEKRLQSLRSIGIGGHISEDDAAGGSDPYRTGMMREVTEEVTIGTSYQEELLGFIHDPRTFVGSVHLGVVHRFHLEQAIATSREEALAEAGFCELTILQAECEQLETWSQFVLASLARSASE